MSVPPLLGPSDGEMKLTLGGAYTLSGRELLVGIVRVPRPPAELPPEAPPEASAEASAEASMEASPEAPPEPSPEPPPEPSP